MITRLQDPVQIVTIMRRQTQYTKLMLEAALSRMSLPTPSERQLNVPANLENTELSAFMPKSVLLYTLAQIARREDPGELQFIEDHQKDLLGEISGEVRALLMGVSAQQQY
jgi:hypothetical protein